MFKFRFSGEFALHQSLPPGVVLRAANQNGRLPVAIAPLLIGGRAKRGRMREGGRTVKRSRRLVFYIRSVVQLLQMHIKTEHIAIPHQSKIKIFDSFPPGEALGAPAPQQLAAKSEFGGVQIILMKGSFFIGKESLK